MQITFTIPTPLSILRSWRRALLMALAAALVLAFCLVGGARPAAANTWAAVSAGGSHTCALTTAGGVKCWGATGNGQLGIGTGPETCFNVFPCSTRPVDVSGLTSGVSVKCWGYNVNGQLGDAQACGQVCTTPVDVTGLASGVAAVSAGWFHTCALTTAGGVKCWGYNYGGELGNGTTTTTGCFCIPTPVDVSGLTSGVGAVSSGYLYTCAVTTAGGAKCWGFNGSSELGDGTQTTQTTPVDVSGLTSGVVAMSAGLAQSGNHTCAVTTGARLYCWGYNANGELGRGNTDPAPRTPVEVYGLTIGVVSVSVGDRHTCAVTTRASVRCWGSNGYGQLGDSTNITHTAPWWPWDVDGNGIVRVSDILGVVQHFGQDGP